MRLIDADKLHLKLLDMQFPIQDQDAILDAMDDCIVDAAPATHGKWVKADYKPMIFTKCSLCGRRVEIQNKSAFCPGCGARMTNGKA